MWLAEPRGRLRMLAELADSLAGAPGGQLVGKLHTAAQHGEPATRGLVSPSVSLADYDLSPPLQRVAACALSSCPLEGHCCKLSPLAAT